MIWQFIHYPAGDAPSRDCAVRAPSLDAARRKLARALSVPAWTLRALGPRPTPRTKHLAGWRVTHYAAGDAPSRDYAVRAPDARHREANARRRLERPRVDAPIANRRDTHHEPHR